MCRRWQLSFFFPLRAEKVECKDPSPFLSQTRPFLDEGDVVIETRLVFYLKLRREVTMTVPLSLIPPFSFSRHEKRRRETGAALPFFLESVLKEILQALLFFPFFLIFSRDGNSNRESEEHSPALLPSPLFFHPNRAKYRQREPPPSTPLP